MRRVILAVAVGIGALYRGVTASAHNTIVTSAGQGI